MRNELCEATKRSGKVHWELYTGHHESYISPYKLLIGCSELWIGTLSLESLIWSIYTPLGCSQGILGFI